MMNGTVHQIKCGMIVHNMAKRTELKNGAVLGEGIELGEAQQSCMDLGTILEALVVFARLRKRSSKYKGIVSSY